MSISIEVYAIIYLFQMLDQFFLQNNNIRNIDIYLFKNYIKFIFY